MAVLVGSAAFAQQASIIGTAVDDTKSVLPGVSVTATDQEAGRQMVAITNERGEYRLLNVPPGKYTVQAELAGFSSVVLKDVELLVGQNATIPFVMKLAQVSETLTVVGETPLVDTTSSQVTGNVDRRQMEELPLQGRNWMELSKLIKGITANDVTNTPGVSRDDDFQLNLDGQQITQKVAGSGFGQPKFSREAIAEFQIVTNLFDVTQGRSAGIQVQAISRSGTNTMAGSVYGFFRDDKFNAPDPVANRVLPYQNQQVGGSLGGPIVKDKVHFFASVEYERAVKFGSDDPNVYLFYGVTVFRNVYNASHGSTKTPPAELMHARKLFEKAAELAPQSPFVGWEANSSVNAPSGAWLML